MYNAPARDPGAPEPALAHDFPENKLDRRLAAGATVLAGGAAAWPVLALPAVAAVLLVTIATSGRPRLVAGLVGGLLATVGFVRFVVEFAAPNVIAAGQRSAEEKAVSRLREILWAQERARELGLVDRDRDGVGEFLTLAELTGRDASRLARPLDAPLLKRGLYVPSEAAPGPFRVEAYLFVVHPGATADDAERRWVGYAWPAEPAHAGRRAFFVDERETICETVGVHAYSGSRTIPAPAAASREGGPGCGDGSDGFEWRPWRGRQPRSPPG